MKYIALISGIFLFVLGAFVLGALAGYRMAPDQKVETRVVVMERPMAAEDTSGSAQPDVRKVFAPPPELAPVLDTLACPAPEDMQPVGLVSRSPVKMRGDRVTLSYWHMERGQYVQDTYVWRPPSWGYGLYAGIYRQTTTPIYDHMVGVMVQARLRYRRLSAFAEGSYTPAGLQARAGLMYRFAGRE